MGKVVSFINMKGGVGKTTMAVNIGYTIAKNFGKKVLLIDVDPQMNATQYTLKEDQVIDILENPKKTIYGILFDEYDFPTITSTQSRDPDIGFNAIFGIENNFDIIPSHLKIIGINLNETPLRLRKCIKDNRLKDKYDLIILDSPPTISAYTRVSLLASDAYVVPMKTDFLSLFGLPLLESYIQRLRREFDLNLEFLGIILTMVRTDWKIYRDVKKELLEKPEWKNKIFEDELKNRTIVAKALSPDERAKKLPYIIELGDEELESQMLNITREFMQKLRL
ncbi:MAG: AAA family ATPase [Nitrospiraceae bacterium]|nr:AAA family ATPase [Nitrospiraceae bacterium]